MAETRGLVNDSFTENRCAPISKFWGGTLWTRSGLF
jgi:hypothetical protein